LSTGLLTPLRHTPSLMERLIDAQLEWPAQSARYFIPTDSLEAIVTQEAIQKELERMTGTCNVAKSQIARRIFEYCHKLFAILVLTGKEAAIFDFVHERINDSHLPIKRPSRGFGEDEHLTNLKFMESWPRRKIEEFCRDQWMVLAPIFHTAHIHYELDDNVTLPFVEDHENAPLVVRTGGYSDVWPVRIYSSHQNIYKGAVSYSFY
jgi:hypothetical protein